MSDGVVDQFAHGQAEPWPRASLVRVIDAIRQSGPFEESIKWGNPFFAVGGHAVVKLFVAHEWINVFFYRGARLNDRDGMLAGEGSGEMRRARIRPESDAAVIAAIADLTRQAVVLEGRADQ